MTKTLTRCEEEGCRGGLYEGEAHEHHPHPATASVDGQILRRRMELYNQGVPLWSNGMPRLKKMRIMACKECDYVFYNERERGFCSIECSGRWYKRNFKTYEKEHAS